MFTQIRALLGDTFCRSFVALGHHCDLPYFMFSQSELFSITFSIISIYSIFANSSPPKWSVQATGP